MPPKKNGKKNRDQAIKTGGMEETEQKNAEELTESDKKFYQAQIRDLEERLERYQLKCDELEVQEKDLSSKINNVEKEKKDIVLFLKRTLAKKEDKLNDLAETLSRHQQAQEAERESFESQLSLLRRELQENKEKYTSENMTLAGKLASLEEFSTQRETLIAERRSLEEQLRKQKEDHQAEIYNLEKKAVLDNDRLKKEMLQHVATVAAEFRRVSDEKMPETTLRAMQENLSVTAQLQQLSEKTKELLKENDALRARERQLKRENGITEPLLHEITKKSVANQKVVLQLTEKCKQMQSEVEKCTKLKQDHQELLDIHSAVCTEIEDLRKKHAAVTEDLNQTKAEVERQKKELEEESRMRAQINTVLEEAAVALKEALRDVPEEEDSELKVTVRRSQMMQKLLAVLDGAAALGKGPALTDLMTCRPGALQKTSPHLSHYKTGDLGLVPRKTHSTSTKMGNLSRSAYTSLQKKA
ncbi:cilia- and flagella-associated protein 157 [Danio rerio]|uniref:Cilia- and flagella-associated protein 157 n=1 Tax=Danio rerio TaxID=7955 RepID=CF157_DANRE|nr:cilia- and flagella-associated protein 157 [Danio rerio]A2BDR7.1 RecName: Full=Cilia- and flagella-associated protein 157 [Danio rerio]|eukprot:NP_001103638.1 cilia- and flagella-associated protein 157 [Danio rerio]